MNNILTTPFPTTVTVNGTAIPIYSDFRTCLTVIMAFEDPDLTPQEKQVVMFSNLYGDIPDDLEAAGEAAISFLNGERETKASGPRVFSFKQDAPLIFAAFRQTHNIDLETTAMHWWKFLALFMDLGQDTTFCQLTALRRRIKTGKATKEEREAAMDMPDLFDLDEMDSLTLEEREVYEDFWRKVEEGQKNRDKEKAAE